MSWVAKTLSSSLGKKLLMAGTGLFLCTFLIVHLIGNLQLLKEDNGQSFNIYASFMTHNPLIKVISYGLYFFIILHSAVAIWLTILNKKARPADYAVSNTSSTWASRSMMLLGTMLLIFIGLHMVHFWARYHFDNGLSLVSYGTEPMKNLYEIVDAMYDRGNEGWIGFYVISQLVLGFHLSHGFASAFQTFGLNHRKYTPIIKGAGLTFSIVIALGFAIIPILMYLN